ncbi:MAG: diguanylate cyclase, partial [Betaproteobacteria bacterium]
MKQDSGNPGGAHQSDVNPPNEAARVQALQELRILDTPSEEVFDSAARLAAEACRTPIALISLVDADRLWSKACFGPAARNMPRESAFCSQAILDDGLFEVPDARADARFAGHPLVTAEPGIRFYAGMPLITAEGLAMGALCVMDHVPRVLDERERTALRDLAAMVVALLESRKSREESKQLGLLLNEAFDEIFVLHPGSQQIQYANANALAKLGYRLDELQQLTVASFGPDYPLAKLQALSMDIAAGDPGPLRFEAVHTRKDGSTYQVEVRATLSNSQTAPHLVLLANDISTRKRGESLLRRQATVDGVTGLMNRRSFESRLRFAMQRVRHDGGSLALLMIEIDHLTQIRHSYGQQVADRVLADFADRLSECTAANDLVAHLGGDEFAILVESKSDTCEANALAAGIRRNLERRFTWEQSQIALSANIGMAHFAGADESAATFMDRADAAVNIAFLKGTHQYEMSAASQNGPAFAGREPPARGA